MTEPTEELDATGHYRRRPEPLPAQRIDLHVHFGDPLKVVLSGKVHVIVVQVQTHQRGLASRATFTVQGGTMFTVDNTGVATLTFEDDHGNPTTPPAGVVVTMAASPATLVTLSAVTQTGQKFVATATPTGPTGTVSFSVNFTGPTGAAVVDPATGAAIAVPSPVTKQLVAGPAEQAVFAVST